MINTSVKCLVVSLVARFFSAVPQLAKSLDEITHDTVKNTHTHQQRVKLKLVFKATCVTCT